MMKDSIDRQTIFAIVEHRYPDVVDGQYRVGYADAINDVLKDISYMPSTESEIIKCKDSIVYRKDVVEALYQALRTQLQGTFTDSMSLAMNMAQALPSVESEIIHCKDCKYYGPEPYQHDWCVAWENTTAEFSYCSYAERKTDE